MNQIICGDTLTELKKMPDEYVDTIITSPPYWGLRDYGIQGQIGLEKTLEEYISKLLAITQELKRVLKKTGIMFWNHGDCYGGSGCGTNDYRTEASKSIQGVGKNANLYKTGGITQRFMPKCMILQNYRLILRMIDKQGWILRNTIIWHKPNHMPSSVKDRFANAYDMVFMLVKNRTYYFDLDAVRQPHKVISLERLQRGVSDHHKYSDGAPGQILHTGINKPRPNIRKTKIPKNQAETFGSPRARYHRKQDNVLGRNAPMYKGFNKRWKERKTNQKIGIKGGGNWEYGGINSEKGKQRYYEKLQLGLGKNPGDIIEVPSIRHKSWCSVPGHAFTHERRYKKGEDGTDFWCIPTQSFPEAHFATFPEKLIEPMIKAGTPTKICPKCNKILDKVLS